MENHRLEEWRILLIGSNERDYLSLSGMAGQSESRRIQVEWAKTPSAGLEFLRARWYSAVFIDIEANTGNSIEFIRNQVSTGCEYPLIAYSMHKNAELDAEAFEAGVTLSLGKGDLNPGTIERFIHYAIERKRMDRDLSATLLQKSIILDSIQDGLFGLDRTWRVTYANCPVLRVTNCRAEDLIGCNIWEQFPLLCGTWVETCYRLTMQERVQTRFETQGAYDGKWYSVTVNPSAEGISISWHDITERKLMEEQLALSERKYREIIKYAPTAIYEIDFRTRQFTSVNDSMVDLSGYSREELLQMDAYDLMDDEGKALFGERVRKWLSGEKPDDTVEYRIRAKDGRLIYAMLDVTFTTDENGSPTGAMVIGHDITARKQAELEIVASKAALEQSQDELIYEKKRLQAVMEALPVGLAIIDENGGRVQGNLAYFEIWGEAAPRVEGIADYQSYLAWWVDTGRAVKPEEWASAQAVQHGKTVTGQYFRIQRFDGTIGYILNSAAPIYDAKGKVSGCVVAVMDVTEKRHAEEALQFSEAKFSKAFFSHPSLMTISRVDNGKIVETNPMSSVILGCSRDEVIGQSGLLMNIFAHPEDYERLNMMMLEQGSIHNLEVEFRTKSGENRTLLISIEPILLDGEAHVLTTGIDITERKHAEKSLLESNQALQQVQKDLLNEKNRLLAVMEALPVGMAIFDDRGERTQRNRAFEEVWGHTLPDVHGVEDFGAYQAWWVDSGKAVQPNEWALATAIRTGESVIGQFMRIRRFDGSDRYVLNSAAPMRNYQGKIVGGVVAIMDITERVLAEKALTESEERFRVALSALPISVYQLDRELRYIWVDNPIMGLPVEQILGKRDDNLFPPEMAEGLLLIKQSVIDSGQSVQKELEVLIDEKMRYYLITLEPVIDQAGSVTGLIGASLDITEQRQIEMERQRTLTQIEVQHRLMEQREHERQGMARDLHDGPIQTLSAITFHLKLIHDTFIDPAVQMEIGQVAMDVKNAVRELRDIMNELRPPSLMHFGLARVIQLYTIDICERNPRLEVHLDVSEEKNLSEHANLALYRIYQASMGNILQHSGANKAWLTFKIDADQFLLEIRDNGKGFENTSDFSRLTREGHFGLVGMKERAESIGAAFEVLSAPGEGTTIRVTGPLKENGQ